MDAAVRGGGRTRMPWSSRKRSEQGGNEAVRSGSCCRRIHACINTYIYIYIFFRVPVIG